MSTLRDLYDANDGKLSDRWTLYIETYDQLLTPLRDHDLRMLEIGIQNGGSLEIWSKYFPQARCLIGCDINPKCELLQYDDPRVTVIVGDANTDETQARIRRVSPALDLVIDDGSHTSGDIVRSFARYFPMLVDGGVFIVEDLHCSYWSDFDGGLFDPTSSIAFLKALADVINFEHWGRPYRRGDVLARFCERWGVSLDEDELARVHSVEFINSICVVRKAAHARNVLGPRVIARGEELVATGHPELAGALIPRFDQAANPRSGLDAEPTAWIERQARQIQEQSERVERQSRQIEEQSAHIEQQSRQSQEQSARIEQQSKDIDARDRRIEDLEARLGNLQSQVRNTTEQLSCAMAVIEAMKQSRSWRYSRWMRDLGTFFRPKSND